MYPLGSENHPIMIKVRTRAQAEKIATICDAYDLYYIISSELHEDLTVLQKRLKDAHIQLIYMIHVLVIVGKVYILLYEQRNRIIYKRGPYFIQFGGILFSLA